jgi:hypothetical protein
LQPDDVKEIIKWDIEVIEKKTDERFNKIESQIKSLKKSTEDAL